MLISENKSFGVMVDKLGKDQTSYTVTKELNRVEKWCPILFFFDYDEPMWTPNFARMQMEHSFYFGHPVVATSLETAQLLIQCLGPTKKFYYMFNLDWLYYYDAEKKYRGIYQNPALNLIVRNEDHARLVEKCWLRKPFIVEDFNYERIVELF